MSQKKRGITTASALTQKKYEKQLFKQQEWRASGQQTDVPTDRHQRQMPILQHHLEFKF